jgi:hypothetical protein
MTQIPWGYKRSRSLILQKDSLAKYFRRQLIKGDFIACVYGPKRIGKSLSIIGLCMEICPTFNIKDDVVFYLEDFYKKSGEKEYGVKLLDDFGSELDPTEAMFDAAKNMSHDFQTSGTYHTGYFITTPNKKFINKNTRDRIADYFIEIKNKNEEGEFTEGVVQWIQQNNRTEKQYNHSLFLAPNGLINNRGIGNKIWNYTFNKPSKEIEDEYYPMRLEKAERNRAKGHEALKKSSKRATEKDIAKKVLEKVDYFSYVRKNGNRVFDKGLIETELDVGSGICNRVLSIVKSELRKKEPLPLNTIETKQEPGEQV